MDKNERLQQWCLDLEASIIETVESGKMTKDLAILVTGNRKPARETWRSTEEFLEDVDQAFRTKMGL